MAVNEDLIALFPDLLARHVPKLTLRGDQARGCCPIHQGDNPQSFSASLSKGAWLCHGCGAKGGVVAFAQAIGERLPAQRCPSPAQQSRAAIERQVQAEYRAWKDEHYGDCVERIAEQQSIVASLLDCQRFALSNQERQTLGRVIAARHDEIAQWTEQMDRYAPNPLIDDTEIQGEWIINQELEKEEERSCNKS
jgi:DNA primase